MLTMPKAASPSAITEPNIIKLTLTGLVCGLLCGLGVGVGGRGVGVGDDVGLGDGLGVGDGVGVGEGEGEGVGDGDGLGAGTGMLPTCRPVCPGGLFTNTGLPPCEAGIPAI